jgi:hypothetical protein
VQRTRLRNFIVQNPAQNKVQNDRPVMSFFNVMWRGSLIAIWRRLTPQRGRGVQGLSGKRIKRFAFFAPLIYQNVVGNILIFDNGPAVMVARLNRPDT